MNFEKLFSGGLSIRMVRKKSACGRSVRKVRKNKIARASLTEEREMGSEGMRSQSMDMLSEEKMNERVSVKGVSEERNEFVRRVKRWRSWITESFVQGIGEKKRTRSVRSGGDPKRLRKEAGDRMESVVRKSSTYNNVHHCRVSFDVENRSGRKCIAERCDRTESECVAWRRRWCNFPRYFDWCHGDEWISGIGCS